MTTNLKWYGDDFLKQLREETPDALFDAAETFVEQAASRAPYGDGDLQQSGYAATEDKSTYQSKKNHKKEIKAPKGGAIAAFADFKALWVEFGTKPHKIGKAGQLLQMPDGNVVRGPISHPGTSAKPFFRPTLDEAKGQLAGVVTASLKKKFKK